MPLPSSNIVPGKINFERLSNYIKNVIDPLSAILEISGIQITEYTFRKVYNQEKYDELIGLRSEINNPGFFPKYRG